jgi:Sigma-70 region 2
VPDSVADAPAAPALPTNHYFNSPRVGQLIVEYQKTKEPEILGEVLKESDALIASLIRQHPGNMELATFDELVTEIYFKIFKSVKHFNPERGTAYSFLSRMIINYLASYSLSIRNRTYKQRALHDDLQANSTSECRDSRDAIEDIMSQLYLSMTTPLTLRNELSCSRWYLDSFIDAGFEMRRNEYAAAAKIVYGVAIARARELYDLTMLSIRRALYDPSRVRRIAPEELTCTKSNPWPLYAEYVSSEEFTKLVTLTRGLAPYILFVVNRNNEKAIRKGDENAIRGNLELILCGSETDGPLFAGNSL